MNTESYENSRDVFHKLTHTKWPFSFLLSFQVYPTVSPCSILCRFLATLEETAVLMSTSLSFCYCLSFSLLFANRGSRYLLLCLICVLVSSHNTGTIHFSHLKEVPTFLSNVLK